MGTTRVFFLFLIVLIQLFSENEAVNANGTCIKKEISIQNVTKQATRWSFIGGANKLITYTIPGTIVCGDLLNVSQPAASNIVATISRLIALQHRQYIKYPHDMVSQRAQFQQLGQYEVYPGFRNVDCAIDCTHIKIVNTPGVEHHEAFRNRKSYFSINVQKNVTRNVSVCCAGYTTVKQYPLTCVPKCSMHCNNGFCRSPNECGCYNGYVLDQRNKYNCLPLCNKGYTFINGTCRPYCSNGCPHGSCVKPETCVCNSGWKMVQSYGRMNKTCQPICSKPCQNGTCIAPETCQCKKGYLQANQYSCKPNCSRGCPYGTCIGPDTCQCYTGYILSNNSTCSPYCSRGCPYAICVAPETCSSKNYTSFSPMCSKGCINSTCVAYETCQCYSGYVSKLQQKNICRPNCSDGCLHGVCVSPQTCICNSGWKMTQTPLGTSNKTCQPICSEPCVNSTCVAPETCKCLAGYSKITKNICEPSKNTGNWAKSNWVYILVIAIIVLVILLIIIIVIARCKRRNSLG